MSFIAKNPISTTEVTSIPPVPIKGTRGIFAKEDGWYDIDSEGNASKLVTEDDIPSTHPAKAGDVETAIVLNDVANNHALAPSTTASGTETIAGIKGYFFQNIEFGEEILNEDGTSTGTYGECKITLTKEQPDDITIAPIPEPFEIGYAVGDELTLTNDSKYPRCCKITAIDSNIITVDSLPFNTVNNMAGDVACDDYQVFCPDKLLAGVAPLGYYAHAEGEETQAIERASHAEGRKTKAIGQYSHAEGRETEVIGYTSHAEGQQTRAIGQWSHAEGYISEAWGMCSHSEGKGAVANGNRSHAQNEDTVADGIASTAGGRRTHAYGPNSVAFGYGKNKFATAMSNAGVSDKTLAELTMDDLLSIYSIAPFNMSYGMHSLIMGDNVLALGVLSSAFGGGTIAYSNNQYVTGKFNEIDKSAKYAHIVGGGTGHITRKNIHTLDWSGNAYYAGDVETDAIILRSSTKGSTKKFKLTIDDSGAISVQEIDDDIVIGG